MPEKTCAGPVTDNTCSTASKTVKEAVCIHTKKIFDACRDKDCIENIRVILCRECQILADAASAVRPRSAELINVNIDVEPIQFNKGFFTVDVTYFYRVTVDFFVGRARPVTCSGLAFFNKRVILFGSEGGAKIFSSETMMGNIDPENCERANLPRAVVEAVDPILLDAKLVENCEDSCECIIPENLQCFFDDDLVIGGEQKTLFVTLGQFSLIRLERDTQLLIPAYDYCIPQKECVALGGEAAGEPCDIFKTIKFPTEEFFPPSECQLNEDTACTCC